MLEFGTVYFKSGITRQGSPEEHFIVVLAVDEPNKLVWYQTLTSQVHQVFKFPSGKPPRIDIDTVAFLNYQKYTYLDRDTCIMMQYGVTKESKSVFKYNIQNGQYKLKGKIIDHNRKSIMLTLKCATEHANLSEAERARIFQHYQAAATLQKEEIRLIPLL